MQAKDVMTSPVVSVTPDAPLQSAVSLMLQHRISGLPVVEAGRLIGILTEGDLLRRSETGTERTRPRWLEFLLGPGRLAAEYAHTHGRKVGEVMTREPHTVDEDTALPDIVDLMERCRIKRVPVMRDGQLVGIVTRANLMQALASIARTIPAACHNDSTICGKLMAEIDRQPWAPRGLINITVKDGCVDLWGAITDEREREALYVLAENTPGVTDVHDHLVWVEPTSGFVFGPGREDQTQAS
jgi:CBS domain-containing protein